MIISATEELEDLIIKYAEWLDNRRKQPKFRLASPTKALFEEFCKQNNIEYYKKK